MSKANENPRQKLARQFRNAVGNVELKASTNGGTPTDLYSETPVFGRCRLFEHPGDETPDKITIGYVELEGKPNDYLLAIWARDSWRTRSDRPFQRKVVRWFHLEREDGSTPF